MPEVKPRLTYSVELAGGQNRLRQMVLYVSKKCANAERFGLIKLNKILWKSDFTSYAEREVPISGRRYQREKFGPIPKDMKPLHRDMAQKGQISVEHIYFDENIVEHRTIPLIDPDLTMFTEADIAYIDRSVRYYWDMTGMETSDDSHGVAWKTRANGEAIPYEAAFLSDEPVRPNQLRRLQVLALKEGWTSD